MIPTAARIGAIAALFVAGLAPCNQVLACSCDRGTVESALATAALVAEIEILEVELSDPPGDDNASQSVRARVVRVFSTETSIADGDEIVFVTYGCNSEPWRRDAVGGRLVAFLGQSGRQLTNHFCSFSLDAWAPLPHVLLQARRQWRARH